MHLALGSFYFRHIYRFPHTNYIYLLQSIFA